MDYRLRRFLSSCIPHTFVGKEPGERKTDKPNWDIRDAYPTRRFNLNGTPDNFFPAGRMHVLPFRVGIRGKTWGSYFRHILDGGLRVISGFSSIPEP